MTTASALRVAAVSVLALAACGVSASRQPESTPQPAAAVTPRATPEPTPEVAFTPVRFRDFVVVDRFPHDPAAYTQGLTFFDGWLLEGTGRYGESSLRRVELETGRVAQQLDLGEAYFGEGIALLDGRLYQLTWRSRLGFVWGADDFRLLGDFRYATEGWGLTTDGTHLIMSDGTATLHFLDPHSFRVVRTVEARDADGPVWMLNELELVDGAILANVWQSEVIVEISPQTGAVTRELDFSGLVAMEGTGGTGDAVLNGIAWDAERRRLFVTGKLWSHIYEVELLPP